MTPPKFANDCLSGIEDSTKGSIIGAAIMIYRKVQRFLRPTHLNRLPGFSAQRSEKRAKQICKFVEVMYLLKRYRQGKECAHMNLNNQQDDA